MFQPNGRSKFCNPIPRIENADGEIRTHITLFLRQVPLPLGYVGATDLNFENSNPKLKLVWAAGFEPANTCFQNTPVSPSTERPEKCAGFGERI
jgi:hypothetical protein